MSEKKNEPLDPKAAMREALERKRAAAKGGSVEGARRPDQMGTPHGQAGGKRQFRRKSGG